MGNLSSTFVKAVSAYSAAPVHGQNKATNIIKPRQTRIYRKKYVNGSANSKGHQKIKIKTRLNAYSGLDLSIYIIKSPIQLVRQSLQKRVYMTTTSRKISEDVFFSNNLLAEHGFRKIIPICYIIWRPLFSSCKFAAKI
jgi:hypothetical protein